MTDVMLPLRSVNIYISKIIGSLFLRNVLTMDELDESVTVQEQPAFWRICVLQNYLAGLSRNLLQKAVDKKTL